MRVKRHGTGKGKKMKKDEAKTKDLNRQVKAKAMRPLWTLSTQLSNRKRGRKKENERTVCVDRR